MTRRQTLCLLLALGCAATASCNVFLSIGQCASDADCPGGSCDALGRFCNPRDSGSVAPPDDANATDAGDAGEAGDAAEAGTCAPEGPFTAFDLVRGFEDTEVLSARFTPDEQTLLYAARIPENGCSGDACSDLLVATRKSLDTPFAPAGKLAVSSPGIPDYWPTMTADGLVLFFESTRQRDSGAYVSNVWTATRLNAQDEFHDSRLQTLFDVTASEGSPYIHPNGQSLYFMSDGRPGNLGGLDIYVAKLGALGLAAQITNVAAVNSISRESAPVVTLDDKVLYFAREDSLAIRHIWRSTRALPTAEFGAPSLVGEIDGHDVFPSWVSDDQCRLYFIGMQTGLFRLWVASRAPR